MNITLLKALWTKSYHFLNSSLSSLAIFSLLTSEALESKMDNFFAANMTSSLFGTMIAPRRRWSYISSMPHQKKENEISKWNIVRSLNHHCQHLLLFTWPMTTICWIRLLLSAASSISDGSTFSPISRHVINQLIEV